MFNNSSIQSTFNVFNGNAFGWYFGFGMYSSSGTVYYYVMDYNKVFILNDQWEFISFKVFTYPSKMISIENSIYMTGDYNVWKVDKDLNILINYNPGGNTPNYVGISYNPSNGFIYVAAERLYEIQVFNMDLTLIRRISTLPHIPFSITVSSNQLYVGTEWNGIIFVYKNESLVNQFNGCGGNSGGVSSILFDANGYMATSCVPSNILYLFSPDGSFTGKIITTPQYDLNMNRYIGFDSKGRFILISYLQITIYN